MVLGFGRVTGHQNSNMNNDNKADTERHIYCRRSTMNDNRQKNTRKQMWQKR